MTIQLWGMLIGFSVVCRYTGTPAKAVILTVAGRIVAIWPAGYKGTKHLACTQLGLGTN